jgi:hypothetical protein
MTIASLAERQYHQANDIGLRRLDVVPLVKISPGAYLGNSTLSTNDGAKDRSQFEDQDSCEPAY